MALSKIQLSHLLATYGNLITAKQREIVTMYCDLDCTLTEIASEHGISRQGVRDAIVKAENALVQYEQCLGLAQFTQQVSVALQEDDGKKVMQLAKQFVSGRESN